MTNYSLSISILVSFIFAGCAVEGHSTDSNIATHTTQTWSFAQGSQPLSMIAESGSCAANLPVTSMASGYCYNEIPAVQLKFTTNGNGTLTGFCLATHLPGMSSSASLLVVDSSGNYVSEVSANGNLQMIDSIPRSGQYRFYVGFPTPALGQRVTIRLAELSQFSMSSPACNFR